jgi:hypothetical protein
MTELAQRAVACKHWRWLPGMRWVLPGTDLCGRYRGIILDPEALPDLSDDLTRLGLLALVRGAWGDWSIVPVPGIGAWGVGRLCSVGLMSIGCIGETEAEALVAALEAAP